MAGNAISFDGNSLQTANILTSDILHEQYPDRYAPVYSLAHENRSTIPFIDYPAKTIHIKGKITDSSPVALDSSLDTFRSYFKGKDKNLDIGYGGGTRRYTATPIAIAIDRPGGLAFANFEIEFTATIPFGQDTANTSALNGVARTNAIYAADTHSFLGTAPVQLPIFTVSLTAVSTSSTNLVTNPGFEVDTSGWSSGGIGTFTRVTTQHNSGVAAGQMVNAAASPLSSPVANTYGWELYPISGLVVGAKYSVSLWLKGNAGGESLGVQTLLSPISNLTLTTAWQQVSFLFTATGTTDQIYVFSTTASATWFLDDVSILQNNSGSITIGNANNGQAVTITRTWIAGDILIVDCLNKTLQVNGADTNFSGAYPEFPPGSGTLTYQDTFTTRTFTETVNYKALYL